MDDRSPPSRRAFLGVCGAAILAGYSNFGSGDSSVDAFET